MAELTPLDAPKIPLRDMLTHVAIGNVLGFAILGPEETADWTDDIPPRRTRVGEAILKYYQDDNVGVEPDEHELGTDLFFETDDTNESLRRIAQPLTAADADLLINNLPAIFLDHEIESTEIDDQGL